MDEIILLVTANSTETHEVMQILKIFSEGIPIYINSRFYTDFGVIEGKHIYFVQSEMGSSGIGSSSETIENGIDDLSPQAVYLIGIAYGTKPKSQKIGHILISERIICYDNKRVGKNREYIRGDRPHASEDLIKIMKGAKASWTGDRVHFGLLFTGETLVDNIALRNQMMEHEPDAIGGEMEATGLYQACTQKKVNWIIVKGISDWGDGKKDVDKENRQKVAARNSITYILHSFKFERKAKNNNIGKKSSISNDLIIVNKQNEINIPGVLKIFENLDECSSDMREQFSRSKKIKLLLQIGRRELGGGKPSLFYTLSLDKTEPTDEIQVLCAALDSPFLSEERAKCRGGRSDASRWKKSLERLQDEVDYLKSEGVKINVRFHKEPFLWRMFIMDDIAYISGYIYPRDNDSNAVIYKFSNREKSLYSVYDHYFTYLWQLYSDEVFENENEKWKKFK